MKIMKIINYTLAIILLGVLSIGCGGGGSGGTDNTSVIVVDGYVLGTTVKDAKGNIAVKDVKKPGKYNFTVVATFPLFTKDGNVSGKPFDIIMSAKSGGIISPISTMINNGISEESIALALGYKEGDKINIDFIEANNTALAKLNNAAYFFIKEGKIELFKSAIAISQTGSNIIVLMTLLSNADLSANAKSAIGKLIFSTEADASKIEGIILDSKFNTTIAVDTNSVVTINSAANNTVVNGSVVNGTVVNGTVNKNSEGNNSNLLPGQASSSSLFPVITGANSINLTARGGTININATITNQVTVTYESSDTSIVKVDAYGLLTGMKTGETNVTITALNSAGVTKKVILIYVKAPGKNPVINAPGIFTLEFNTTSNNPIATFGTDVSNISYSVANSNIADINSTGFITSKNEGNTTITIVAKTSSGAQTSATVKIVVKAKPKTFVPLPIITVPAVVTISVDQNKTGLATSTNTDKIYFASNNRSIAKVTLDGNLTGVSAGEVNISIAAYNVNGDVTIKVFKVVVTDSTIVVPSTPVRTITVEDGFIVIKNFKNGDVINIASYLTADSTLNVKAEFKGVNYNYNRGFFYKMTNGGTYIKSTTETNVNPGTATQTVSGLDGVHSLKLFQEKTSDTNVKSTLELILK